MSSAPKEHVARHLAVLIDIPFLPCSGTPVCAPMMALHWSIVFLGAAHLLFLPVWVLQFPLASMQLPRASFS